MTRQPAVRPRSTEDKTKEWPCLFVRGTEATGSRFGEGGPGGKESDARCRGSGASGDVDGDIWGERDAVQACRAPSGRRDLCQAGHQGGQRSMGCLLREVEGCFVRVKNRGRP